MIRSWFGIVCVAVCAALPLAAAAYPYPIARQGALIAPNACAWHVVKSANGSVEGNDLFGIFALSSTDAWAGGFFTDASNNLNPLLQHWNGVKWKKTAAPNPGYAVIYSISGASSTDVWAIGAQYDSVHAAWQTLAEHWNGSAWSIVASANTGFVNNFLFNVSVVSANDVWAVGNFNSSASVTSTLIEHWNGSTWSIVNSPNVGTASNSLTSASVVSPTNVWASGGSNGPSLFQPLVEHWNGVKWKVVSAPSVTSSSNPLNAITAVSANDVWAVGDFFSGSVFKTLAEHWNGTAWSVVSSPNSGMHETDLFGAAAVTTSDVWAVGQRAAGAFAKTFTMNRNGTAWSVVASPSVGAGDSFFNAAGKIPGTTNAWAVGATDNADHSRHHTLIAMFHC